jgi:Lipocalin-like domain
MQSSHGAAIAALAVGFLVVATGGGAAQSADTYIGSYTAVSVSLRQGDQTIAPLGSQPVGSLMMDAHGRFSWMLMRARLPVFATNDRMAGTPEEYRSVMQGNFVYFGTYTIDHNVMTLKIEGSTFPNWTGAEQKRVLTLRGDLLTATSSTPAIGDTSTETVVWKRVK